MYTEAEKSLLANDVELTKLSAIIIQDLAAIYFRLSSLSNLDPETQKELRRISKHRKDLGQKIEKNAQLLEKGLGSP